MDAEIHVAAREGDERDQNSEEAETEVWKCPHAEKTMLFCSFLLPVKRGTVSLKYHKIPFLGLIWCIQGAKTDAKVILGQTKATERAKWNIFVKSKNAQDIQQQKSEHWVKMIWIAKTLAPTPFEWSYLIWLFQIRLPFAIKLTNTKYQVLILSYFFNKTITAAPTTILPCLWYMSVETDMVCLSIQFSKAQVVN